MIFIYLNRISFFFISLWPLSLAASEINFSLNCPEIPGWSKAPAGMTMQVPENEVNALKKFQDAVKFCRYINGNSSEIRYYFTNMMEYTILISPPHVKLQIREKWESTGVDFVRSKYNEKTFYQLLTAIGGTTVNSETLACPPSPGLSYCTKNPILNPKKSGILDKIAYGRDFTISIFTYSRDFTNIHSLEIALSPKENKTHTDMFNIIFPQLNK